MKNNEQNEYVNTYKHICKDKIFKKKNDDEEQEETRQQSLIRHVAFVEMRITVCYFPLGCLRQAD